ncbi:MAG TPA: hypothetical protein VLA34_13785, partial [Candidatus Krumholzibacterium sp.]|nr:hypothetical protein [Candidatus Krumholzibacterium sp.]
MRASIALMLAVILSGTTGCNETDPAGGGPTGDFAYDLVFTSDCIDRLQPDGATMVEPPRECCEYSYDGEDMLTIRHVDFALNCCPGEITATVSLDEDVISIIETEGPGSAPCDCLCLYITKIEITGISPGSYNIIFDDTYTHGGPALQADIDLLSEPAGLFCEDREFYPWGL